MKNSHQSDQRLHDSANYQQTSSFSQKPCKIVLF